MYCIVWCIDGVNDTADENFILFLPNSNGLVVISMGIHAIKVCHDKRQCWLTHVVLYVGHEVVVNVYWVVGIVL